MLGSVRPPADGFTHFLTSRRGFLLDKTAPAAHDLGGSVDDVNPAVPIIINIPTNSHSLGSLRSRRISIINSRATGRAGKNRPKWLWRHSWL